MPAATPADICRLFQRSMAEGDIEAGDTALMHTEWTVSGPRPMSVHAIEVARRQADGTWRWLIGDPFTVGKRVGS